MANPTAQVPATTTPYSAETTRRPCAATAQTFYTGEMLGLDTSGNIVKCDDAATVKFDGVGADGINITVDSGDAAGDKNINTQRPRYMIMKIASAAAGDEGRPVWAAYSNEVQYFPGAKANFIGYIHRVVSSTEVEVEVDTMGPNLVAVTFGFNVPVDQPMFIADRAYRVVSIIGRTLGTAASATGVIKKAPSGTAIGSGTALHSSSFAFDGTTNTNQVLTLSTTTADLDIASGDSIGIDVTGTLTGATGCITILLAPRAR